MADGDRRYDPVSPIPNSPPGYLASPASPTSPQRESRNTYQRLTGAPSPEEFNQSRIAAVPEDEVAQPPYFTAPSQGLRIDSTIPSTTSGQREPISRVPVGSKNSTPQTPGTAETFSPQTHQRTSSATTAYDPSERYGLGDDYTAPNRYNRRSQSYQAPVGQFDSSTERLNKGPASPSVRSATSRRSKYDSASPD
jgi:hypothetical protein